MATKKGISAKKRARRAPDSSQEARSESTPARRLAELAEQSTALARLVARNPSASGSLLQKLGSHSDATVRKSVTLQANTPPKVLVKLATQFPEQLLENPIVDLLLLENPNLLNELPVGARRSLIKREKCPVNFLEWLAQDYDEGVQLALAMNPNTPPHVLKSLAKGTSDRVTSAAKRHINFPTFKSSKGSSSDNSLGRVLRSERLTESEEVGAARMLTWLPCIGGPSDRQPLEALRNWARDQMEALPLARSRYSDAATLTALAGSNREDVQLAVAKNRSAPPAVLKRLAAHPYGDVREAVAGNPSAPSSVLKNLAADQEILVRYSVAARLDAPLEALRDLSMDKREEVRASLAANEAAPRKILTKLAGDKKVAVRLAVARNRATPVEVLTSLAQDRNMMVRAEVAAHPRTPQSSLIQLANSRNKTVRLMIARNPCAPPDVLAKLVDETEEIRWTAATNKNTRLKDTVRAARTPRKETWEVLGWDYSQALARHSSAFVEESKYCSCEDPEILRVLARSIFPAHRRLVAENPLTPTEVLETLANDGDFQVVSSVARSASSTPKVLEAMERRAESIDLKTDMAECSSNAIVLEKLAKDRSTVDTGFRLRCLKPVVRIAVAGNPAAPEGALRQLSRDTNFSVRFAVADNPGTPDGILEILANDKDSELAELARSRISVAPPGKRRSKSLAGNQENSRVTAKQIPARDVVLAGLPGIAHIVAAEFVADKDAKVRRRLAANPLVPETCAEILATDSATRVRVELAANPGISPRILEILGEDPDKQVARIARRQLRNLENEEDKHRSRQGKPFRKPVVATRRALPPPKEADFDRLDDWQYLSRLSPGERQRVGSLDGIPRSRRAAVRRAHAEAFLRRNGRSNRPSFKRLLCLLLPECPIPVLARAVRSTDWKERLAVASHPETPTAIRRQLAKDGNKFVRAAAREAMTKGA